MYISFFFKKIATFFKNCKICEKGQTLTSMREGQMMTDLKISCSITFRVRRSNFSALSDFEIITLVPDAPAYWAFRWSSRGWTDLRQRKTYCFSVGATVRAFAEWDPSGAIQDPRSPHSDKPLGCTPLVPVDFSRFFNVFLYRYARSSYSNGRVRSF